MGLLDDQRRRSDKEARRQADEASARLEYERSERERLLAAGQVLVAEFLAEVANRGIEPDFAVKREYTASTEWHSYNPVRGANSGWTTPGTERYELVGMAFNLAQYWEKGEEFLLDVGGRRFERQPPRLVEELPAIEKRLLRPGRPRTRRYLVDWARVGVLGSDKIVGVEPYDQYTYTLATLPEAMVRYLDRRSLDS